MSGTNSVVNDTEVHHRDGLSRTINHSGFRVQHAVRVPRHSEQVKRV